MKVYLLSVALLFTTILSAQKGASVSFEKWLSLKNVSSPIIAPDGKTVVYAVTSTDWTNNAYDTELWMYRDGNEPLQLTRTSNGSSTSARVSPDSKFVSFLADRGDKTQLYIIAVNGGEAMQVTKDDEGIGSYEWSEDGSMIAFTKAEAESPTEK